MRKYDLTTKIAKHTKSTEEGGFETRPYQS